VVLSTMYESGSLCLCSDWTQTMAANLSITASTTTVGVMAIIFTRAGAYKNNDSCHVEHKNWLVIRRMVGYDRFSLKAALKALGNVYPLLHLYINFLPPVLKLVGKTRHGAKVHIWPFKIWVSIIYDLQSDS